jgi:putative transposase
LLPDHLHMIWRLPPGDADFSTRWSVIKRSFTRGWLASGGAEGSISDSRRRNRRRGVWQRRFWERCMRDPDDLNRHIDYVHYNPVKHGLVRCPHAWEWSSFHRWVRDGYYEPHWCCACDPQPVQAPDFGWADEL